jgi:hypothetical protein
MIFVRNAHGHNPLETLALKDSEHGTALVAWMLAH